MILAVISEIHCLDENVQQQKPSFVEADAGKTQSVPVTFRQNARLTWRTLDVAVL